MRLCLSPKLKRNRQKAKNRTNAHFLDDQKRWYMPMLQSSASRTTRATDLPPLENGDRLDQKTFHRRYEAMPEHVRAELIGGIVYMASPLKKRHGRPHAMVMGWLSLYEEATPRV